MDIAKAENELGWQPQMDFDQGLTKTINWYINNRNWWEKIKGEQSEN